MDLAVWTSFLKIPGYLQKDDPYTHILVWSYIPNRYIGDAEYAYFYTCLYSLYFLCLFLYFILMNFEFIKMNFE